MESTRQAKISRLIQKELSEIFRQQTAKTHGVLVSVSAVRVSPDLSIARAYLSVFPSAKAEEVIESVNKSAKTIRYELLTTSAYFKSHKDKHILYLARSIKTRKSIIGIWKDLDSFALPCNMEKF